MRKRVIATLLWFYAGWYGGVLLADFLGVSHMLGPVIGAAAAFLIAADPRKLIWRAADAVTISSGADTTQEIA